MATTNDAMYDALRLMYPTAGATLGDLLSTHWSTVGVTERSLIYQYYVDNGALGSTLGDLANSYFVDVAPMEFDMSNFNVDDFDEWLELQVFDRYDTVEQAIFAS